MQKPGSAGKMYKGSFEAATEKNKKIPRL